MFRIEKLICVKLDNMSILLLDKKIYVLRLSGYRFYHLLNLKQIDFLISYNQYKKMCKYKKNNVELSK